MTFSMRLRGPTASFWLALLIVSGAFVAYLVARVAHDVDPEFTPLAAPLRPAFLVAYVLGGGPHGLPGKWWYDVPVTFVIALAMWWAVLEGCRRLWNLWRSMTGPRNG